MWSAGLGAPSGDDERDPEGKGLAGPGGGAAAHVAACERVGDGGRLDLERLGDASSFERGADGSGHAQQGEFRRHGFPYPRVGGRIGGS